eukprot:CAMPEP_0176318586 /NCGR_PEP_ID=MMETSP0121_2-20121125/69855_1 /TAXON_ID=160619 /ORGANISM="Kryptoperidinium foliaceum, Strain CCMP 1326" /LENGTH=72 /DNA_ID=CAMNT_0017660893 /DNA_START=70 /DNA_END=288 /DNA_ORIENTATION=+
MHKHTHNNSGETCSDKAGRGGRRSGALTLHRIEHRDLDINLFKRGPKTPELMPKAGLAAAPPEGLTLEAKDG